MGEDPPWLLLNGLAYHLEAYDSTGYLLEVNIKLGLVQGKASSNWFQKAYGFTDYMTFHEQYHDHDLRTRSGQVLGMTDPSQIRNCSLRPVTTVTQAEPGRIDARRGGTYIEMRGSCREGYP